MKSGVILAVLAAVFTACALTLKPEKVQTPDAPCSKVNVDSAGCLAPFVSDNALRQFVAEQGFTVQRHHYAPAAENAKGECQQRYVNIVYPNSKPRGVFFYVHGGGGDVGSADYTSTMSTCLELARNGYVAASIEYRRGWTGFEPFDQWCDRTDPFKQPAENYEREQVAAYMSFSDAAEAVRFVYGKVSRDYPGLESYISGTSFGGAISLYVSYYFEGLSDSINLQGCLNQYGGYHQEDSIHGGVPLLSVGGVADDLVPFWNGPTYCNPDGVLIYGTGGMGLEVRKYGIPSAIVATCNTGHGRGATDELEILQDLVKYSRRPKNRPTVFLEKTKGGAVPADSCFIPWQTLTH